MELGSDKKMSDRSDLKIVGQVVNCEWAKKLTADG